MIISVEKMIKDYHFGIKIIILTKKYLALYGRQRIYQVALSDT